MKINIQLLLVVCVQSISCSDSNILNLSAFNIQKFGVAKFRKSHVVTILSKVSAGLATTTKRELECVSGCRKWNSDYCNDHAIAPISLLLVI